MDVITVSADPSGIITGFVVVIFACYMFVLGWSPAFRHEMNEFLNEVFDAAMTDDEMTNLGPTLVIPPFLCLVLLGLVFLAINIKVILLPLVLLLLACLFTASRRRSELQRKALEALSKTEL